ncbi:hypothetical protein FGG08_002724 [Glutinoglossum americanum]|uniref:Uncharacterized protein n=1 Tax=Glutinoglossum americanum TaxID=1670608 RepID=A0A9P8I956_9PEZI|nr:hypothetical protein FGG08_002724 [Glutinoglossum americanum]
MASNRDLTLSGRQRAGSLAGRLQLLVGGDTAGKEITVTMKPTAALSRSPPHSTLRPSAPIYCKCSLITPPYCQHQGYAGSSWGPGNLCWEQAFLACELDYNVLGPGRGGRHWFDERMFRTLLRRRGFGEGASEDGCVVEVTVRDGGRGVGRSASRPRGFMGGGSRVGSMFSGGRSIRGGSVAAPPVGLIEDAPRAAGGGLVPVERSRGRSRASAVREGSGVSRALGGSEQGGSRSASRVWGGGGMGRALSRGREESRSESKAPGGSRMSRALSRGREESRPASRVLGGGGMSRALSRGREESRSTSKVPDGSRMSRALSNGREEGRSASRAPGESRMSRALSGRSSSRAGVDESRMSKFSLSGGSRGESRSRAESRSGEGRTSRALGIFSSSGRSESRSRAPGGRSESRSSRAPGGGRSSSRVGSERIATGESSRGLAGLGGLGGGFGGFAFGGLGDGTAGTGGAVGMRKMRR